MAHTKAQKDKVRKSGLSLQNKTRELGRYCDVFSVLAYWTVQCDNWQVRGRWDGQSMVGMSSQFFQAGFAQVCTFHFLIGRHGTSGRLPALAGRLDEDGYGEMLVKGERRSNSCSARTKACSRGLGYPSSYRMRCDFQWCVSAYAALAEIALIWGRFGKLVGEIKDGTCNDQ